MSAPLVTGVYPVTAVGSPLNPHQITSVVAVPVAEVVTAVAQAADDIALVPSAEVPLMTVVERPPAAERLTAAAVATPVPSPLTPVDMGKPVILEATPDAGVPSTGVTSVGLVARTKLPVPVSAVQAIVVPVEFSMTHGAVAPTTVVAPGVMVVAPPPGAGPGPNGCACAGQEANNRKINNMARVCKNLILIGA